MASNYKVVKYVFKPNSPLGYYIKKEKESFPGIFTILELLFAIRDILNKYKCSNLMTDPSIHWNKELEIIFHQESTHQTELKALINSHILPVPANVSQLSQIRIIKHVIPAMTNEEASTSTIKYRRTKSKKD